MEKTKDRYSIKYQTAIINEREYRATMEEEIIT